MFVIPDDRRICIMETGIRCEFHFWKEQGTGMNIKKKRVLQIAVLAAAAAMIVYGLARGEAAVVFNKAVNV